MRPIAVIQANYTDLLGDDRDPSHYCLEALRKSRYIERIVIAAPDLPENDVLLAAAEAWGVDCHLGSEFDVTSRIVAAVQAMGAADDTLIARVLLNRFFLDIDLVDRMIELLEQQRSDYVTLPYDFNINFGADVMTLGCLARAEEMMPTTDMSQRFRPWLFIEEHTEIFRVTCLEDVPTYSQEMLEHIRGSSLSRERDCGTCAAFTYEFALQFLKPTDNVLDLGCGVGEGSALLAEHSAEVCAADYDVQAVRDARARHNLGNLRFDVQDAHALNYADGAFDVVVCSNVMEHVADDALMLQSCRRVLRTGGSLVLEVPLLAERPFAVPLIPSHFREYRPAPLLDLIRRSGFAVARKFGLNRGRFVDWDRAREGVLVVAHKVERRSAHRSSAVANRLVQHDDRRLRNPALLGGLDDGVLTPVGRDQETHRMPPRRRQRA
jgi:spore coat polysaccharide biosynthesis protein SpsF (cytidylyltransferase family)